MEEADEAIAQRVEPAVGVAGGSTLVVVDAGAGAGGEGGERPLVAGVSQSPVAGWASPESWRVPLWGWSVIGSGGSSGGCRDGDGFVAGGAVPADADAAHEGPAVLAALLAEEALPAAVALIDGGRFGGDSRGWRRSPRRR